MVIGNRKEREMYKIDKEECCKILNDFAKRYDITIISEEKPNFSMELRFEDNHDLWKDKYELPLWDVNDLRNILMNVKYKFNLKGRDDGLDAFLYSCVDYDKCFKPKAPKPVPYIPEIKNVIFNEPATIVIWSDGTKTVVKCQEGEGYDPEKGLAMAISKKALGNKGNYCEVFKKWLPEEEVETERDPIGVFERFKKTMDGLGFTVEVVKEELENSTSGEKNK